MTRDQIKEIIGDAGEYQIIAAWNNWCENENYGDDTVYNNDNDTYTMLFGEDIDAALRAASYGEYTYTHEYCCLDGYGNLVTFNYICDSNCPIDTDTLVDYFEEHEDELGDWFDFNPDDYEEEEEEANHYCPECGCELEQGEYEYDYESGKLVVCHCPDCGCEGEEVETA